MTCEFEGTARSIHLRGQGPAIFVHKGMFAAGAADRVEVHTARVGDAPPTVTLADPRELDPIALDIHGGAYDVSYAFEGEARQGTGSIQIVVKGGRSEGDYRGSSRPECATAWCSIRWNEEQAKKLVVFLSAERITTMAALRETIALTDAFPYPGGEQLAPATAQLTTVSMTGARGELRCDSVRTVSGQSIEWQWAEDRSVKLPRGIALAADSLAVHVHSSASPEIRSLDAPSPARADPSPAALTPPSGAASLLGASPAAALAVLLGIAVVLGTAVSLLRRRRRPAVQAREPGPQESAGHVGPIRLCILNAQEDAGGCESLAKHLTPIAGLQVFHEALLLTGETGEARIPQELERAHIVILLVSADFLNDEVQVRRSTELMESGKARLIAVRWRPADAFRATPLGELEPVALPKDGSAITTWDNREAAYVEVVRAVRDHMQQLCAGSEAARR